MASNVETFDTSVVERFTKKPNPFLYGLMLLGELIFIGFFLVVPYLFPLLLIKIVLYLCVTLPALYFLLVLPLASDGQTVVMSSVGIDSIRQDNKEYSIFGGAGGLGYSNAIIIILFEKLLIGGIITGVSAYLGYVIGSSLADSITTIPYLTNDTFRLYLFSGICFFILYLAVFYVLSIIRKDKQSYMDIIFGLKSYSETKKYYGE